MGATPSGCAGVPPRKIARNKNKRRKKKKGAARRLATWPVVPGRLGCVLLAAWPVRPDRLDPPRAPRVSRATPSGCADALRERRAAPAILDDVRLGYTKINVSSSPAYFCTTQAWITSSDARDAISAFYYSCSTVRPGASQSWPGGWTLGLRRLFPRTA